MDSGVGPNGTEGQADGDEKTPPDAETMRLGRARVAKGEVYSPGDPIRMARPVGADSDLSGGRADLSGGRADLSGGRSGLIGGGSPLSGGSGLVGAAPLGGNSGLIGAAPESSGGSPLSGGSGLIGGASETPASDTIDLSPRFRPWSESTAPGNQPLFCHFLRSVGPDGKLSEPRRTAVPTHRCAAFGDPLPLSLRQQELVCLQRVHVSCPRYLRGTLLASEGSASTAAPAVRARSGARAGSGAGFSMVMVVGIALMVLTLLLFVTGVAGRLPFLSGPGNTSAPTLIANAPTPTPTESPTAVVTPVVSASPSATASASRPPSPVPSASSRPSATAVAVASWPPGATASRMKLVVACGDQANCYVYTVRSGAQNGSGANDNLQGIVTFFGVDMAAVKSLNPWLHGGTAISAGDKLRIPPPTR